MFCTKCGKEIGETRICPHCDTEKQIVAANGETTVIKPEVEYVVLPTEEPKGKKTNVLAILALCVGVIGLPICLFTGSFWFPIIGIIFGIIGLVIANKKLGGVGRKMSIFSIFLSCTDICIGILSIFLFVLVIALIAVLFVLAITLIEIFFVLLGTLATLVASAVPALMPICTFIGTVCATALALITLYFELDILTHFLGPYIESLGDLLPFLGL